AAATLSISTTQPTPQPQPAAAPKPQPTTPKPAPTTLPTLPTSVLGTLAADQAQTVKDGRNALAAGDYSRAVSLFEPLVSAVSGEQQAEVRLLYGQALVGDRQFDKGLATSESLLTRTTRAD